MTKFNFSIFVGSFFLFLVFFSPIQVLAAPANFSLMPSKLELKLDAGASVIRNFYLTNNIGRDATFRVEIEDVSAGKELKDAVEFYGASAGPYSIKNYLLVNKNQIFVKNGETIAVPVMISVPYNSSPGGLYGAILFSVVNQNKPKAVATLTTRLGSLIFLRVKGDVLESGEVLDFNLDKGRFVGNNKPINFQIVYENTGNVYVNPYGYIDLKNNLTQKITRVAVSPYFVFPNSTRLMKLSSANPYFGYYTATLHLNRGYDNQLSSKKFSFVVFPINHALGLLVAVVIIWFGRKMYKKKKVSM